MVLYVLGILAKLVFVIFFFGLCIFLHELGHLLVALWRGLHVERFSVGFGKKIWGWHHNGVEYVLSVLPVGGYVALPQLDPTEEPTTAEGRKLPHAPPLDRAVTALSGPVANLLFGFFLGLFVWWFGIYKPAPADYCEVATVPQECPEYEAGLRPGDRIIDVNGRAFANGWEELSRVITLSTGEVTLGVERDGQSLEVSYVPAPNPSNEGLGVPFFKVFTPIIVRRAVAGFPAQEAGILPRDRIVRMNGNHVTDAGVFAEQVAASRGAPFSITVERNERVVFIPEIRARLTEDETGKPVYRIGVEFGAFVLTHPSPWKQFVSVFTQTRDTLRSLFSRRSLVKPQHMSGPVGIVQIIWYKVTYGGFVEGLSFVILISFSLAFFNLLPIPVLDGGHILFALVELLIRRRIPTRIAYGLQTVFAVLLICFMVYITFYDVKRFPRLWRMAHPDEETKQEEVQSPAPPTTADDGKAVAPVGD